MSKLLHKLPFLLALLLTIQAIGKPDIDSMKRYHIVCNQFPDGCTVDGSLAKATTPLYYQATATTEDYTYWIIEEHEEGLYTIQNVKTKQYITYDGQRADAGVDDAVLTRRYVDMTNETNGDYSLWRFQQQSNGVYVIRNASITDHIWDVRTDSYVVGTYSNTGYGNSNQVFSLYDEEGRLVVEIADPTPNPGPTPEVDGIDVSSWLDATTDAIKGWDDGGAWQMAPFGDYNNTGASVSYPFIEKWHDSSIGGLPDCQISQTLVCLPAGKYMLQADVIAVLQSYNAPATGVTLFAGDATTNLGTYNEMPNRYQLSFTLTESQDLTFGIRLRGATANWVAFDNLKLFFYGTNEELIAGERAKIEATVEDMENPDEYIAQAEALDDDFDQLEALRKKIVSSATIKPDPISKAAANLCINGHSITYAKSTNIYLCSIPLSQFGSDLTATISYKPQKGCGNLFIDGKEIAPESSYTFKNVVGGKNYTLSIQNAKGTDISIPLTFTSLPVVQIYGSFNNDYSDGFITVSEPDKDEPTEILNMKAKWRGGITNGGGKHKRNYHVKLKDAAGEKLEKKFFGLRNDNSWILESCQVDMLRIRNRTITDLWNDFSTPPYYIDKEPKAMTGTRGHFVELILNGEYNGIYCMTENIDRKQMKLKKYDEENNVTHGQLWKSKDWSYATMMGTEPDSYYPRDFLSNPNENNDSWDNYNVKYPDFEDYGYNTDWSTLYNAVDFVCHSSDEQFRQHVAEYFDLPLLIDYYILQEVILSTDNHGKNMFFGVYDKQKDKKITFAVWDMDATCGQRWSDDYYHWDGMNPEQDYAAYIQTHEHGDYNLFRRLRNTDADNFNMKVRQRYQQLRQGELQTDRILQRFRTYLDEFKTAGSDQREYARWSGDSDVAGHSLDFDVEMEYLTDWFTRRMNYLDEIRFDIGSLLNPEDKYKLTYQVDGIEYKTIEVEYGATIIPEVVPMKEGYTFSGWNELPKTMPANDVTVTGTFIVNKYKLTYTVDDKEYKTIEIEYGAVVTPESLPTKYGYTFSGWSEIPETMPAHDVTVTGTFTINKYKLIYKVNGTEYKTVEIEYGAAITPEDNPTKEGYTFSGWGYIPKKMPAYDLTITGAFIINTYKLTYMIDSEVYKVVEYKYGAAIIPEPQPEGDYVTFVWKDVPETMPANDVTVYADYQTGISDVLLARGIRCIYAPNGKRIEKLQKGLNIVVMNDGTVRKVVIK